MRTSGWPFGRQARRSRRQVLGKATLTGAAALAAALAGCGGKEKLTSGGAAVSLGQPGQAAATAAAADFWATLQENPPDPFTERDIKVGGTFVRLSNRQVTLDFMAAPGATAEMTMPVYSRLIRLACRANMKSVLVPELEGDLAIAWEQPDTSTLTLTLAPNIKYQPQRPLNGRTFSVEDITFSFNRGKTFPRSLYKSYYNTVARVEDVGDGKVKLTLAEPYPALLQLLASFFMAIMPPEIGENPDLAQTTAVGTGGMMIVRATPNVEFVYQKHPEFFKVDPLGRRRPYLDGYTLSVVNDEATRMALFESGRADLTSVAANVVTLDNVQDFAKRNPKIVIQKLPIAWPSISLLGHHDRAPWSDLRVRQAVGLCLDRETIIKTLYHGQATIGPFFPWPYLFEKAPGLEDLGPNYTYNPQQAKQLLAAAGFPNGLDFDLHWYEVSNYEQVLTLFKQAAAEAGLHINLVKSTDNPSHNQKLTSRSWTGLIMAGRGMNFIDPAASLPFYLPDNALNYGNVNDPQLVALYRKLESSLGEERKAVARQIYDHLRGSVYDVTLPNGDLVTAWWPRVRNFRDTSWSANGGYGMGNTDQMWVS